MELSLQLGETFSILTEVFFGQDLFFRQVLSLANETLTFLSRAKGSSELDVAELKGLKTKWDLLSSSKRFFRPAGRGIRLKKKSHTISIDIAKLQENIDSNTNTRSLIDEIEAILKTMIKDAELLLHGDPLRLLGPAIQSTRSFLKDYYNGSSGHRSGRARLIKNEPWSHEEITLDLVSAGFRNKNDPRDIWNTIRRYSLHSNTMLYNDSIKILRFLDRIISKKERQSPAGLSYKNIKDDNSPDVNALMHEIRRLSRYMWIRRRKRTIFILGSILYLSGFLLLILFAGLSLSRIIRISSARVGSVMASEGERILVPMVSKSGDERWSNPNCSSFSILKLNAVRIYLADPRQAQSLMKKYLTLCPNDAEAQVYLNNYEVTSIQAISGQSRPIIKLAVVVPLLRQNGIRDSFEILRGISLAQHHANSQVKKQSQKSPYILVRIFNDGTNENTEQSKGLMAQKVAESIIRDKTSRSSNHPLVGVIGHFSSGSTEAASKIYHIHNIPVISPTSTNRRESLNSYRYTLNGVKLLHAFQDYIPFAKIVDEMSSYYTEFLFFLNHFIFDAFSKVRIGHLDLDPNIFRMPPTDDKAQKKLLEYIQEYNRQNPASRHIQEIVVVSEEKKISKYSANFLISLKEISGQDMGYGLKIVHVNCLFYPGNSSLSNYKKCVTDALGSSTNTKALLVVPSSSNVNDALNNVKQIMEDLHGKKELIVLGADSLMSAFNYSSNQAEDPIYDGIVVSATTDNSEKPYRVYNRNVQIPDMVLTWRSHMAYDSVIFFHAMAVEAISHLGANNGRKVRSYILNNFTKQVVSEFSNGENIIQFDPLTHDRQIDDQNKRINILLCKSSSVKSRRLFRLIEFTDGNDLCK
jgi:ABC-type branched-subunit amino acid transport system substrate-binding protein